jgi:ribosomal protein L30E
MTKANLTQHIEDNNVIIGENETLRALKAGEISHVYLASNAKDETVDDVEYYADLQDDVHVTHLDEHNADLGDRCKKPFNVQIVSIPE